MTRKNRIERGEKVSLELTQEERTLLLNVMHGLTEAIRDVVRATPIDQPVMLTLDDLDDLEWHVAAEATHTKDKKLRQRLEAISKKLLGLMDLHNDEPDAIEGPETLSFVEQFVEFMVGPGPLVEPLSTKSEKGDDQYGVKLTEKQRESILHCTEPSEGLRRKIQQAGAGVQTLGFTRDELDELAFEVDYALADARTPHKQRLAAVYDKLEKLLDALELAEQEKPVRHLSERTGLVYQFKVTLSDSKPPIWRRFQVPDLSLGELHKILQIVMGWQDSHMHQFMVGKTCYGQSGFDDIDRDVEDEDGILISQVFPGKKKPRIVYEYDFGDSWQHEIVLEETVEPEPKVKYPRCIDGARACPPEDCGSIGGYAEFLEAISDPKHPDHRDMKEWIGGKFDPERFSVDKVSRELRQVF